MTRSGGMMMHPTTLGRHRDHAVGVGSIRYIESLVGSSPRAMADLEERLWNAIGSQVRDPELDKDLKTLQYMNRRVAVSKDGKTVQILLKVPTMLHPSLDDIRNSVQATAETVIRKWGEAHGLDTSETSATVVAMPEKPKPWTVQTEADQQEVLSMLGPGLANVSHFLAVYSCKGGVGKSTIAVNLAYELARMGGRVGLLDVDVYGPSLPVLIHPEDPAVRRSPLGEGMIYPIQHRGVKILSLGYVSPKSGVPGSGSEGGAAVMRGPMAGKVVAQLLKGTDWGDLDVLILDLPPGTGDVQLAVCQDLQLSGAVAVTTPSSLAIADVKKGIEMFSTLNVPTLAMVENMAYFECEGGGRHYPFGKGITNKLGTDEAYLKVNSGNVFQLPISEATNEANDAGQPLCISRPENATDTIDVFGNLAKAVSRELFRLPLRNEGNSNQLVTFEGSNDKFDCVSIQLSLDQEGYFLVRVYSETGASQIKLTPSKLRDVDPKSGDKLKSPQDVARTDSMIYVHRTKTNNDQMSVPKSIIKKGGYGYEVVWGDGTKLIYSKVAIAKAAGGTLQPSQTTT